MHEIEPFDRWIESYDASKDPKSPFFGEKYNDYICENTIYNYYIHPYWDYFGAPTLYAKILFTDYQHGFTIIELFGEWNDAVHNDIMYIKRNLAETLNQNGINKFILIGENILNFHHGDDDYYQEWFDDIEDGWIVALNFRQHVIDEFILGKLDYYIAFGGVFDELPWRRLKPKELFFLVEKQITKRLSP